MLIAQREGEPAALSGPDAAAVTAGLRYVSDARPGIRRVTRGKGFAYVRNDGRRLTDRSELNRIRALAIPPAWRHVWICPLADGHLQATGRDARGRKQYRYHPRFRNVRESTKYEHVVAFADALPEIRTTVRAHMTLAGLPRDKVLATVVHLLDNTLIRVGNDAYAKQNKSYGLTTLKNRHVEINGSEVRFHFIGKSGKEWSAKIKDRRVAKIIKACQDLPGQELLQYRAEDGTIQDVSSTDVNEYLRRVTGRDITAKDFRTWAGTVLAAIALRDVASSTSDTMTKRNLRGALERVAARLGNTPAICRKCYVHPEVLNAYLDGTLAHGLATRSSKSLRAKRRGLEPEEAAVLRMLRSRLKAAGPNGGTTGRARHLRRQLRRSVRLLSPARDVSLAKEAHSQAANRTALR